MNFVSSLRNTTNDYIARIAALDAEIEKLKEQSEIYSPEYLEKLLAEERGKRDALVNAGKAEIRQITEKYKADVSKRFIPDGSKLEDAAVLNSGLNLSQHDLEALFDKHEGNVTMQRLISDYAASHEIHFNRAFHSEAAKYDGADTLAQYATGALTDSWRAAFIQSDKYFATIIPPAVQGE